MSERVIRGLKAAGAILAVIVMISLLSLVACAPWTREEAVAAPSPIAYLEPTATALPPTPIPTATVVIIVTPSAPQFYISQAPLENSGFEGGFREVDGIPELKVADYWTPWWDEDSARPEYKIATLVIDPRRVRTGQAAQQWFNNYNTHTAGIYQRVAVPYGAMIELTAWVQAFSSIADDFTESEGGKYRMRIGLDPFGGLDPESPDVVWSNDGHSIEPYDRYYELVVRARAQSSRVTIYIWSQAEWALKHNNGYVDDVGLMVIISETPEPTATAIPATATPVPATSTPGPGTPTPTPAAGIDLELLVEMIRAVIREELDATVLGTR